MLNVIMLNVVMLNAVMPSVVAPLSTPTQFNLDSHSKGADKFIENIKK
jgi:hypothetical protein